MDDDQLKATVDEIISRKKGPIELAFEMYEVMGKRYHAAQAVGRPMWSPSQLKVMSEEYDLARKTLAEELWKGAQAPETGLIEELKSLARVIMPRPKP